MNKNQEKKRTTGENKFNKEWLNENAKTKKDERKKEKKKEHKEKETKVERSFHFFMNRENGTQNM